MNKGIRQVLVIGLLCLCFLWVQGAGVASATAVSTGSVTFTWAELKVVGDTDYSSSTAVSNGAYVNLNGVYVDLSTPPVRVDSASGYEEAQVADVFSVSGSLTSNSQGYSWGYAQASRSFTFRTGADGWVTITIPWTVTVTASTERVEEFAYSYAGYNLSLTAGSSGKWSSDELWAYFYYEVGESTISDDEGVASIRAFFKAGQTVTFYCGLYSENDVSSPVPVPPSMLLLGSGLLGLLGVGIRTRKG